jgi:hypothetical protein
MGMQQAVDTMRSLAVGCQRVESAAGALCQSRHHA